MAEQEPFTDSAERDRRRWSRRRTVSVACTLIRVLCGLFAAALVAWIVLVFGEANPANGVAEFVRGFAAGVSLGFDDLFTPADAKFRVLLNRGLAAIVWLGIGSLATMLIRRFALPRPGESY
ncbi:hypothetical protein AB0C24_13620 [Amycolatopsis japonica]|uniref:hypothetical protein n=1 Tax=Amycolatopsis japonica TaxID=208439 RepID=UPI0033E70507